MKMSGVPNKNVVAPVVPGEYVIVCVPERLMLCGARLPELNVGDQSLQSKSGMPYDAVVKVRARHTDFRNFNGMSGGLTCWTCEDAIHGGQGMVGSPLRCVVETLRRCKNVRCG